MIRSLIARGAAALALLSLALATPAMAQSASSITVKDGTGAAQTLGTGTANGKQFYGFYAADSSGNLSQAATAAGQTAIVNALGSPYQAGGALPLPSGAATAAAQTTGNNALGTVAGTVGNVGSPATSGVTVQPGTGTKFDTVVQGTATDVGASIAATTATTLATIAAGARGFSLQNQTTGNCWFRVGTAATNDFHSFLIPAGYAYETPDSFVGSGILSVYCNVAGNFYGRTR